MVVPDGRTVIASRYENQDLFWAARGSGQAFFAVVTRFWGRTIARSKMWETILKFEINDDNYMDVMRWTIERGRETPKYGTDLNITIDYPEKYDPSYTTDDVPVGGKLHLTLNNLCYCDTIEEARTLLGAYERFTQEVKKALLRVEAVQPRTVEDVFARKRGFLGNSGQERWQINSIMNEPSVPLDTVSRSTIASPLTSTNKQSPYSSSQQSSQPCLNSPLAHRLSSHVSATSCQMRKTPVSVFHKTSISRPSRAGPTPSWSQVSRNT
jgi:hypothetical protein